MDFSVDAIPYVAMAMSQSQVLTDVGTAVLSDTLDVANVQSAELTKMMELSVNPAVGANFDVAL